MHIFHILLLQIYKEDPETGLIHVALSSDSTCTNHLFSAQDGYETLHLEKEEVTPAEDEAHHAHPQCVFPDWMQGAWEGVTIEGGEMVYRDETGFATYRGRCVTTADHVDRFVVSLKSDCGEPAHYCALFQQRDVNVMEFQLGEFSFSDRVRFPGLAVRGIFPSGSGCRYFFIPGRQFMNFSGTCELSSLGLRKSQMGPLSGLGNYSFECIFRQGN